MNTLPTLMALRCFDLSARHGSFTRAAGEVHLTQGAVSHQILGLEAQLGTALFVRRKAGLELTAAGRAYWVEISSALRQLERATQNLVINKGDAGVLNLCVASSFATYWLIPRLSGFVRAHPEVTLNLSTHIGPVDFANSSHDAAIEFCEGSTPGLSAQFILPLELRPYCAPALLASPVRASRKPRAKAIDIPQLLRSHPLLRHTTVPAAWPEWLKRAGLADAVSDQQLSSGPKYDLLSMALNGAIAGLGIALLPDYVAAGAAASGQLASLGGVSWRSDKAYHLRYPEWKADLVALSRFRAWLKSLPPP
ncbi:MAG: LysR substrate-binding domain-containing protein [Ramlibacter sp.]